MTTLVPHNSVFVEDTNNDGIFDIHSGDQVYDQDGLLLSASKALEIDPSLSAKYGFYDQSGQPLSAQLRSQGYVMGYVAPTPQAGSRTTALRGPAAFAAVIAGAAVVAWSKGVRQSDLEVTPGVTIQPLQDPRETFVIYASTDDEYDPDYDPDDPERLADETMPDEFDDFDLRGIEENAESANDGFAVNCPSDTYNLVSGVAEDLEPFFANDERVILGDDEELQDSIVVNLLELLRKLESEDAGLIYYAEEGFEWDDLPDVFPRLIKELDQRVKIRIGELEAQVDKARREGDRGSGYDAARDLNNIYDKLGDDAGKLEASGWMEEFRNRYD